MPLRATDDRGRGAPITSQGLFDSNSQRAIIGAWPLSICAVELANRIIPQRIASFATTRRGQIRQV